MDITQLFEKWEIVDHELIEFIEKFVKKSAVRLVDRDMSVETDSKNIARLFDLNGIDFGAYINFWEAELYEEGELTASVTNEIPEVLSQPYIDVSEIENSVLPDVQILPDYIDEEYDFSSASIKERLMKRDKLSLCISFPKGKSYTIESREVTFELLVALSKIIRDDSIPPFLSPDVNAKATETLPQNETSFGLVHKTYLMDLIGVLRISSALGEFKYHEDRVKAISDIVKNVYFKHVPYYYNGKLLSKRSVERLLLQMQ